MKNEEMMKSGSVWKAIASMAIPSAVIMILMIFYNITDMFLSQDWGQRTGGGSFCGISGIFHYVSHCHDAWKRRLYHDCQSLWGGRKG